MTVARRDGPVNYLANALFRAANFAVLPGWASLAFVPESWSTPLLVKLAMIYIGVVYVFSLWKGRAPGGSFTTLEGVRTIFRGGDDFVINACWVHYLAFDLGIGWMIAQDALATGISKPFTWPCLLFTLLFGPSGFLSYMALKFFYTGGI